ncbi:hypothetical protein M409DRAFT_63700 [Zasmidium cellare ATCC 36951]|uniref:FAD-binding PCMH-type domain-containing protein n=1 Tax=Zasmidium cellare ATCC 36951 TaxID=1080233 RepID=A0A6A6CZV0_ZASCE|nr:uncharacterized protein M409DRAFT_63700 [Zasmidium cellare ATCC 36951]KAF2171422.1 hypothetical protein M409DRAFT_63700 [Zasmidium cellare ATCC 36951]
MPCSSWHFVSAKAAFCQNETQQDLAQLLSHNATVSSNIPANFRWSTYDEPNPALYITAATEGDVAQVVRYANRHNYPFLLQNGGNGWADTFNLSGCGLMIDISNLNQVTFNHDETQATIQGGITVRELVAAAASRSARIGTATCNCLGFLGAALGGGQSRIDGLYGLSVDQLISATVVLASGEVVQTSATYHPDLWWAIRGAGPNFGIVTSAVVKVYPIPAGQNYAWQASITLSRDQIRPLMEVLSTLKLTPEMEFDFYFATSGAPSYTPAIVVVPFYVGDESAARTAFAPILNLNPVNITGGELPYEQWNSAGDSFCTRGGRKPAYGASTARLDVDTWVEVFHSYEAFIASNPTAFGTSSTILSENYPRPNTSLESALTSSYPWRDLGRHHIILPSYTDPALDEQATTWAASVRSMLWATAGTAQNSRSVSIPQMPLNIVLTIRFSSYINFAHGDQSLSTMYGQSLPRLQQLKRIYDPWNRFDQWFPLFRRGDYWP